MRNQSDKSKFLEKLAIHPNVSAICKNTGISKAAIYRWLAKNESFAKKFEEALKQGRSTMCDFSEGKLFNAIQRGEPWAIKLFLENNDPRYHRPKKAIGIDHQYLGVAKITYEVVPNKKYDNNGKGIPPDK